jgi:hypothetical protein
MARPKSTSKPAVRTPDAEGLPHPRRDARDSDAGAKPVAPKNAGAVEKPYSSQLGSRVADRNAGRRHEAGATPRPTDKPLD